MRHLKGDGDTTLLNCSIEDGFLIAGLISVSPFTASLTEVRDIDSTTSYRIELPPELTNQPVTTAFANEYLPLIEVKNYDPTT
jgi:hypothetical protein